MQLLIRAICLQCPHEKCSLNWARTSYKENNLHRISSNPLLFISLTPSLLEFSSKPGLFNGPRKMTSIFSPFSSVQADSVLPHPSPHNLNKVLPHSEPQGIPRLRPGGFVFLAVSCGHIARCLFYLKILEILSEMFV